ncbi:MAG: hypothetical protein M3Y65_19990 [Pseudomonadota bacterium]|nr:hypothetical protein [Pseudomonadota bacterium]
MANPSAACRSALADATRLCPHRSCSFDGIMGDARHAARRSDHNDGNAFDLTHDPDNGIDCNLFAKLALLDRRVQYVIWNRKIYNVDLPVDGWRPYTGAPHNHHMHVSIKAELRNEAAGWPWASLES